MKLEKIDFSYYLNDRKFRDISYDFEVASLPKSREEAIAAAEEYFPVIEHIADKIYNGLAKKEGGHVETRLIDSGYDYLADNHSSPLISIRYKIWLNVATGEPESVSVVLRNEDDESSRMFDVFDTVLAIDKLDIAPYAQVQVDRIDILRRSGFDIRRYMQIRQAN